MTTGEEKDSGGAGTHAHAAVRKPRAILAAIVAWLFLVLTVGAPFLSAGRIGWLEDRTLKAELTGYEAYTKRVRARLLPGVW